MLQIKESFLNRTKGYRCGDTDWYEPYTDDKGELFRSLQREYGRCISKVYVDAPDGRAWPIGWCFLKKVKYDDVNEYFLQEVWVTYREVAE